MDSVCNSPKLTEFSETHIDENCEDLAGTKDRALFFNCTFKRVRDLTLTHCDLNQSKFTTDRLDDMLGFTVTLDCNTFSNVELSPLMFDSLLALLIKSKGNTDKRRQLIDVIGRDRLRSILSDMSTLEQ